MDTHLKLVGRAERSVCGFTEVDKRARDRFEVLYVSFGWTIPGQLTWSGTIRMLMSAETFLGMTVLLTAPELTIFAMEKDGSLQTLTSSSTGRPQASETCCKIAISSGVFCDTESSVPVSSTRQTSTAQPTETGHVHPVPVGNGIQDLDHIEHWFRDRSSIDTRMRIVALGRDAQVGVDDTPHAEHHTRVFLVDPGRVREQDSVDVSDRLLYISLDAPLFRTRM
jgi:hypothetical protein